MTIAFKCPACGAHLKAPDEYGGGKARCQTCETSVQIPKAHPGRPVVNSTLTTPKPTPPDSPGDESPVRRGEATRGARIAAIICVTMVLCATGIVAVVFLRKGTEGKSEAAHTAEVSKEQQNATSSSEMTKSADSGAPVLSIEPNLPSLVALQLEVSEQWDDCFESLGTGITRFRLAEGEDLLKKSRIVEKMIQALSEADTESGDSFNDYRRAATYQTRAIELMQQAVGEGMSASEASDTTVAAFRMWEDAQKTIGAWAFILRMKAAGKGEPLPYVGQLRRLERACTLKQFQKSAPDPVVDELLRYGELVKDVLILRAETAGKLKAALQLDPALATAEALEADVLPVHRRLGMLLVGYTPATPDIMELHNVILSSVELSLRSTQLLVNSLRHTDESQLEESIAMGIISKRQYNEWQAKFAALVRRLKAERQEEP